MRELTASMWLATTEGLSTRTGPVAITGVSAQVSPPWRRARVDLVGDVADGDLTTDILLLETSRQTTSIFHSKVRSDLSVPSCPQAIFINKLELISRLGL